MAVNKLDISMMEDVGTSANQLVQRDGSGNLPAVDGSQLTDVQDYTTSTSDPVIATNPSGGVGTVWYNTTSGEGYVCTDATAGENIWTNIGGGTDHIQPSSLPRQGTQYGYHFGGALSVSPYRLTTIQKYSYTTGADAVDTTADLLEVQSWGSDNTCSLTHGYCAGHQNNATNSNTIQKWPFTSNSNATDVGNLSSAIYGAAGAANQDYGYTQGGGPPLMNEVQRFSFSSDGDATDFGDLSVARGHASSSMSTTHGYAAGGQNTTPAFSNVIDKFAFASNVTGTNVGDLLQAAMYMPGHQSLTYGYRAGGYDHNSGTYTTNTIDKYSFSSDGNSTDVANLLTDNSGAGGSTQTDYGYVTGGGPGGTYHNVIQKFSFVSGTDAVDISNLIHVTRQGTGCQY